MILQKRNIFIIVSFILSQRGFSQILPPTPNYNQDIEWERVFTDGNPGKVNRGLVDQDGNFAVIFMPDDESRIHKIDVATG